MLFRIVVIINLCVFGVQAQKLDISHLTDNVYVYTTYHDFKGTAFPSNSMYIVTDVGVVMVDTPWDKGMVMPLLDSIRKRHHKEVVLCIATHAHDDRTAGIDILNKLKIPTYTSKRTFEILRAGSEPTATGRFATDTTFVVGRQRIETFYPGEGHTADNIVIWLPQHKLLYGGCFIKSTDNNDLGNVADANVAAWPASVKRLMKKYREPRYVIPGHFSWYNPNALRHTLKLLKQ